MFNSDCDPKSTNSTEGRRSMPGGGAEASGPRPRTWSSVSAKNPREINDLTSISTPMDTAGEWITQKPIRKPSREQKNATQPATKRKASNPDSDDSPTQYRTPNRTASIFDTPPKPNESTPSMPYPKILIEIANLPERYSSKTLADALNLCNLRVINVRPSYRRAVLATTTPDALSILQQAAPRFPEGTRFVQISKSNYINREPRRKTFSCVAKGLDDDIEAEEIKAALKDQDIIIKDCWRITSRSTNRPTTFFRILTEDLPSLERLLKFGLRMFYRTYRVEESRPPPPRPLQCTRCFGFNHDATECRATIKCARCGGAHQIAKCTVREAEQTCANCKGKHHPMAAKCPAAPKGEEILKTAPTRLVQQNKKPPPQEDGPIEGSIEDLIKINIMALINLFPNRRQEISTCMSDLCVQLFGKQVSINPSGASYHIVFKPTLPPHNEGSEW